MINPINLILSTLRRAVRRGRLVLLGAAVLGSCVPPAVHTMTVGTNIWPGYEPGYIAELHKLYGDTAIDMRQMQSASDLLRAFRNGSLDVVALTLDDALKLQRDGYDIRVLGVVDISNGLDAIVAHPPITRVDQLNGKAVAVENSALGAYLLGRALDVHGVPVQNVRQVAMTIDQSVALYKSGKVDAVVTFAPYLTQIQRLGGQSIFDSAEIPGEIVDVLITTRQFAADHPEQLRDLISGWSAAIQLIRADSEGRTVVPEIARRLQLTPAEVRASYAQIKLIDHRESAALLAPGGIVEQAARRMAPVIQAIDGKPVKLDMQRLLARDSAG
jgi:NitT/TauT family transport system substrate-binding protein